MEETEQGRGKVKMRLVHRVRITTKTLTGELCKQYFNFCIDIKGNDVLLIERYILTTNLAMIQGSEHVKTYKNKFLFKGVFAIKLETLQEAFTQVEIEVQKNK